MVPALVSETCLCKRQGEPQTFDCIFRFPRTVSVAYTFSTAFLTSSATKHVNHPLLHGMVTRALLYRFGTCHKTTSALSCSCKVRQGGRVYVGKTLCLRALWFHVHMWVAELKFKVLAYICVQAGNIHAMNSFALCNFMPHPVAQFYHRTDFPNVDGRTTDNMALARFLFHAWIYTQNFTKFDASNGYNFVYRIFLSFLTLPCFLVPILQCFLRAANGLFLCGKQGQKCQKSLRYSKSSCLFWQQPSNFALGTPAK
jgi:hypothetical protein